MTGSKEEEAFMTLDPASGVACRGGFTYSTVKTYPADDLLRFLDED
ncbi:MAG: hypothetical protein IKQ36_07325 [Clostridia bacterium]|nr:hypothetical protein [Clostridia bacterium]